MTVSNFVISRHSEQSGRIIGEGLHKEYWIKHSGRNHVDVQVEIIVLSNNTKSMEILNEFSEGLFLDLYDKHKRSIARLPEYRKDIYERLTNSSAKPIYVPWELPDTIDFNLYDDSTTYDNHLYCNAEGIFRTNLNKWENDLIIEELNNGAVCWLRNLDHIFSHKKIKGFLNYCLLLK